MAVGEKIVVIGGNAAGMTAASRAKRLDPRLSVMVVEASRHVSYSICGLPYCLGGRVASFDDLVYFTPESLKNERGIDARIETVAREILPARRAVVVDDRRTGRSEEIRYDKLLIATGYRPVVPRIEGIDAPGVFTASRIEDGRAISDWLERARPHRAVLVGGGYVGLEMAEALRRRGLAVCLVESAAAVFPALDPDIAELLQAELEANGVELMTGRGIARIATGPGGAVEAVELASTGRRIPADLVFVDVGVAPRVDLAASAGVRLGASGAVAVSERMETNLPSIYAAGNCAETLNRVTGRPFFDPLGTVAAKQGRIAGENMAGRIARFEGAVGTAIVQVFGRTAARTGLSARQAEKEGFRVVSAKIESRFEAPYFGASDRGTVKIVAERESRSLLGGQIVGSSMAAVRIDVLAAAITAGMKVEEAAQLDLAYAPPVGTLWNPLSIALNALLRELERAR